MQPIATGLHRYTYTTFVVSGDENKSCSETEFIGDSATACGDLQLLALVAGLTRVASIGPNKTGLTT